MKLILLVLLCLCCISQRPAAALAAADLPAVPTAADEAAADETAPDAPADLPGAASEDGGAARDAETDVPVMAADLTEILLRLDAAADTLAQIWQHVRFWAVAAFAWWFAKRSFRGVS